ncbi:DUF952 domain-containing protein [Demequina sp. NBRC 110055]|uniref:DUF952 domain-containing protein n=1 Tax=Demequina sp. NBRC 110055 TaxID=1570344 RepID=UPI000A03AF3C|nr:DUF952 domain-containing protein [Demequina sp. NBRC 110055]
MTILHVTRRTDWEAGLAAGTYEISGRDLTLADEGFIHCSYPHQCAETAARIWPDHPDDLVVLVIDDDAVRADGVRVVDEGASELFPHMYGPVRPAWVTDVRPARWEDDTFVW